MAKQGLQLMLCTVGLCWAAGTLAENEDVPDMAFLEYLGMWDETDEDWLLLEDEAPAEDEDNDESSVESDTAAEKTDED